MPFEDRGLTIEISQRAAQIKLKRMISFKKVFFVERFSLKMLNISLNLIYWIYCLVTADFHDMSKLNILKYHNKFFGIQLWKLMNKINSHIYKLTYHITNKHWTALPDK